MKVLPKKRPAKKKATKRAAVKKKATKRRAAPKKKAATKRKAAVKKKKKAPAKRKAATPSVDDTVDEEAAQVQQEIETDPNLDETERQELVKARRGKNSDRLLDGATRDELFACIRLLALSVVQHRAKCEFVSFESSMEQLRSDTDESEELGLFVQGKEVLEEALEMVKSSATERPPEPATVETPDDPLAENRGQLRINIKAPIKVLWPGDSDPVEAKLENISWGGAAIHVSSAKADAGDTLKIILPDTQSGSITVEAKIVRTWDLPDGQGEGVATRFSSLSTRDEEELENILDVLVESGDSEGQRKYARLTQRLDIQFDDVEELQATLEDISAGGLGITVPDPLQLGQSFQAVISTFDESCSLKLRARVVHQEPINLGHTELYHVGLKFEHPSDELSERTAELIREIAAITLRPRSSFGPWS